MSSNDEQSDSSTSKDRFFDTSRLEAFSDGVMAIILTIMAFDLHLPNGYSIHALIQRIPQLSVYALSFMMIAIYWNNHHHLLKATERINGQVMWSNMLLLFWMSLIPFLTSWIGSYPLKSVPAAIYGLNGCLAGLAYMLLVRSIVRVNGRDSIVARAVGTSKRGTLSLVMYIAATGGALISPLITYSLFLAVSVIWMLPDRRIENLVVPS